MASSRNRRDKGNHSPHLHGVLKGLHGLHNVDELCAVARVSKLGGGYRTYGGLVERTEGRRPCLLL